MRELEISAQTALDRCQAAECRAAAELPLSDAMQLGHELQALQLVCGAAAERVRLLGGIGVRGGAVHTELRVGRAVARAA